MAPVPLPRDIAPMHTPASAGLFLVKRALLQIRRALLDHVAAISAYPLVEQNAAFTRVIAEQRSILWADETVAERRLQLGKVQNLRLALQKIDGLELPAGGLFSFWKQIGPATRGRGYAPGRELREGCLIPAIGGGLCQLSNTLYAAALDSGAEIVERHSHSRIVPGSAAAAGRDATVAFNYVDLRFRFDCDIRVEAKLSANELVVRLLAKSERAPSRSSTSKKRRISLLEPQATGSCLSCGQDACFRHAPALVSEPIIEQTAFLVDRRTPEFAAYVEFSKQKHDALFTPLDGKRLRVARYAWQTSGFGNVRTAPLQTALSSLRTRASRAALPAIIRADYLRQMENLANTFGRKLRPEQTHLVVSQDLLPGLWQNGSLGGRTFDVLMTRLPIISLQERLDDARLTRPNSPTLGDFRAPARVIRSEVDALAAASRIITPHPEIARLFGTRAVLLPWHMPMPSDKLTHPKTTEHRTIVFPGPTVGRKGCYALREAAQQLNLEILLLGKNLEGDDFWDGLNVRYASPDENWIDSAAVVVQPSLWEESPRMLLRALGAGLPVIATAGCGLGDREGIITVAFDDSAALTSALASLV